MGKWLLVPLHPNTKAKPVCAASQYKSADAHRIGVDTQAANSQTGLGTTKETKHDKLGLAMDSLPTV